MNPPAFQFYATDWLGSQRVQMMTLEEEGAYIRLVAYCWQHGSIPQDPKDAARLIGKGASTTLATNVLKMFVPAPEIGRMTHDRLEEQKVRQEAWRQKSAQGGRKSAELRQSGCKGASTTAQPPLQPQGNTPYSVLRTPSPEVEEGPLPHFAEAEIPSWKEFWAYCQTQACLLTSEWYAKDKWEAANADNWKGKANWQAYARRCKGWWESDGRPTGKKEEAQVQGWNNNGYVIPYGNL